MRTKPWLILLVLTALAASACIRQRMLGQPVAGLDRKLSTFAFIEEGDILTFIVDTKAARYREGSSYLPLEIAVGNRGLKMMTLTRESFTLIDGEGRRYPAASPRELLDGYEFLELDQQLADLEGIVFNKFAAFTRYPSNFSPALDADLSRSGLVQDRVVLPKFGYIIDFIYFPAPDDGILGKTFELSLEAAELEEPAFVKFQVR